MIYSHALRKLPKYNHSFTYWISIMKSSLVCLFCVLLVGACASDTPAPESAEAMPPSASAEDGWVSIFDGTTLNGWTASENPETFSVKDGMIVVDGPRAHLYYTGDVGNHDFKNFEWKAEIMTMPGANSGMYFHTEYQEEGWPSKGYEVQVNNTHSDRRKTGGLYAVADVMDDAPANDNEWFTQHIIVKDNQVTIKVNGETTVEYTEPADMMREEGMAGRVLSSGTIAIQGHDPESVIHYRNVMLKVLD